MTRQVASCHPRDTLNRAAQLMWDTDCGALPVVDDQRRLVGMITDRDVALSGLARDLSLADQLVGDAMSRDLHVCYRDDSVQEIQRIMRATRARRVPVVDDQDRLVGLVTIGDLVREGASDPPILSPKGVLRTLAAVHRRRAARDLETAPRGLFDEPDESVFARNGAPARLFRPF